MRPADARAERSGVAVVQRALGNVAEGGVLRIHRPYRVAAIGLERLLHIADRRPLPGLVLILLEHEAQVLPGRVRILGVLEYKAGRHRIQLGVTPDRADRHRRMVDVRRQGLHVWIVRCLGRVVDRDSVQRQADVSRQERLVVVRVQPGQRPRDEGRVHRFRIVEGGDGLLRVDRRPCFARPPSCRREPTPPSGTTHWRRRPHCPGQSRKVCPWP